MTCEVVVGYYDGAEEPTPIRLVARGKDLAEGEVFETQSDEIRVLGMVGDGFLQLTCSTWYWCFFHQILKF